MEVGSLSSSLSGTLAANLQASARPRQTGPDQSVKSFAPTAQPDQAKSAQQASNTRPVDESESAARARSETEATRPTVNVNGQVVGTRINTTA